MKKCYKAPEIVIVDIDCDEIIAFSKSDELEMEAAPVRESYRSSLWND